MTGALNKLATDVMADVTALLSGDFGVMVATILAIGVLIFIVVKFKGAFGAAK